MSDEVFRDRVRHALELYGVANGYIDISASYEFDELADDLARLDAGEDDPRHVYVDETYDDEMGIAGKQGTQIVQMHRCSMCRRSDNDPVHSDVPA